MDLLRKRHGKRATEVFISPVEEAERSAAAGANLDEVLSILRRQTLDQFGEVLFSMPDPGLPALSTLLPAMPDTAIQQNWNGASGTSLLRRSTWFPPLVARYLHGGQVLDIGCGWGRLVRMMYYYASPGSIIGLDSWPESIALCAGLPGHFALVDDVPASYPVDDLVDVAYAFSVFTHLSESAVMAILRATRPIVRHAFIVTIRPREIWQQVRPDIAEQMIETHDRTGYAFVAYEGRSVYGEASTDVEFFARCPGWRLADTATSATDPNQIAVVLEPV